MNLMENLKVIILNEELAENEEFRDIENYEGLYQVTNYGKLHSAGKYLWKYKKECVA